MISLSARRAKDEMPKSVRDEFNAIARVAMAASVIRILNPFQLELELHANENLLSASDKRHGG